MIVEDFTVSGTNRYNELKSFLKTHLPGASFRFPPVYHPDTNCYDVSIRYDLSHVFLLDELHNKWKAEDDKKTKIKQSNIFRHFYSKFTFSSS